MIAMAKLRAFLVFTIALVALLLVSSSPADAKSSRKLSFRYEQIWPTAVRFLRVDEGLKILEKDVDTGYVLFELKDEGKIFQGSLEVIRRKDDSKRDAVEILLQLSDRPSYMESSILDRLLKKVRAELGTPKEAPAEDSSEDKSKDEDDDTNASQ